MLWLERLRKVFLTGDTMPAYRSAGEDAPNRKMRKDKIAVHLSSPLLNGRGDVLLYGEGETAVEAVETRVAVIAIIVREGTQVMALNDLLHQYGPYIVGRMGVPYREKGVNIISVAMDAPGDVISALSGKLGRLEGVTAKTVYAPAGSV